MTAIVHTEMPEQAMPTFHAGFWRRLMAAAIDGIILPMGPLATYFQMQPLPVPYFAWLAIILMAYGGLVSVVKLFYVRRFGWQ